MSAEKVKVLVEFRIPPHQMDTKIERLERAKEIIAHANAEILSESETVDSRDTLIVQIIVMVAEKIILFHKSSFESQLLREHANGRGCGAAAILEV